MKVLRDKEMSKRNLSFEMLGGTAKCQIASMVLQPGETSGEFGNEHAGSDQVMYVVEGEAVAQVQDGEVSLQEDDVILIEAGEQHQIRCSGSGVLRTLNIYTPPGY
jgi:mannose-6-phosphate isomerase-like protein (cupin superfamily)